MSTLTVEHFEDYYDKKNEKEYSKFNKRRQRKQRTQKRDSLELRTISPMTENQSAAFALFDKGDNLMLHGVAGTGKTFISLYLALDELMNGSDLLDKIIIVRSVVPTRDIGFLPGKESEKMAVYEQPHEQSGAKLLLQLWSKMGYGNSNVEFEIDDIVRSGFVRQWIEARDEMNLV